MNVKKEVWKEIEGFKGKYEISNKGRFLINDYKRTGVSRLGSSEKGKDGYHRVYLTTTNISGEKYSKAFLLHRLVAMYFLEESEYEDQNQVNHIDGDKSNNHHTNLEWVNAYENVAHAKRKGLFNNSGENSGLTSFENSDVKTIIKMLKTGRITQRKIAYVFGVDPMTISNIINSKTWSNVSKGDLKND